jgi:predicted nucleic acid-binding protein
LIYADSAVVVSLYRTSEGTSHQVRRELQLAAEPLVLSPLTLLEVRNAFNMAIHRGEIGVTERDAILADINHHLETGFFRMAEVSQADIYQKAAKLSDHHTPEHLTRSLDLMHVATAVLASARIFLSTDARQRRVAQAEGLLVKP